MQPIFVILEDYDYEEDSGITGDNFIDCVSRQYDEHSYIDNEIDRIKIEKDDILELRYVQGEDAFSEDEFCKITIKKVNSKGVDSDNSFPGNKRVVTNYYTYNEILNLIQAN